MKPRILLKIRGKQLLTENTFSENILFKFLLLLVLRNFLYTL